MTSLYGYVSEHVLSNVVETNSIGVWPLLSLQVFVLTFFLTPHRYVVLSWVAIFSHLMTIRGGSS